MRQNSELAPAYVVARTFYQFLSQGKYFQAFLVLICLALTKNTMGASETPTGGVATPEASLSASVAEDITFFTPISSDVCAAPALSYPQCFEVTPQLIRQRIINNGNEGSHERIITIIMEAMEMSPEIADYIRIVFNHLPGFKIMPVNAKELYESRNVHAAYVEGEPTILIPYDVSGLHIKSMIAHELRHAVMNAVWVTRTGNQHSLASYCYFPNTDVKRGEMKGFLAKGDKKVRKLATLLEKEKHGKLSKKETDVLRTLREAFQDDYTQHYAGFVSNYYEPVASVKKARRQIGRRLEVDGDEREIVGYAFIEGNILPVVRHVDCLQAFVDFLSHRESFLKSFYDSDKLFLETDAHMISSFPPGMIRRFYPDFFNSTQALLNETSFGYSVCDLGGIKHFANIDSVMQAAQKSVLFTPHSSLNAEISKRILPMIENLVFDGQDLNQCRELLSAVKNRGFEVPYANSVLADIAYQKGEYTTAVRHYTRARKAGRSLNLDQGVDCADSLSKVGRYKESEQLCKQVLREPDEFDPRLRELKARCQKIIEEAMSHRPSIRSGKWSM